MNNEKIGAVVIGYGGMGKWHTIKLQELQDEFELLGIYDIRQQRCERAESRGIRAYSSYDEVLADERVKLVTVAIPNDQHKDVCIKAMRAGKNVVCEKPVALSSEELAEMISESKKNGVLFTVHQNRRWDHDFLIVKKIIDENLIGPVFTVESRVHGSRGIPGDWRNKKAHGGGMVLDWGVHLLDQVLQIEKGKKITEIYAQFDFVSNEECEDGFHILLTFEGGRKYRVEVGTSNFINLPRWYVLGENGSAVVEDFSCNGNITMVSDWEKRDAVPVVTAAGLTKTMAPRDPDTIQKYPLPEVSGSISEYYKNIRKSILGEETQIVKHDEMMRVMRLMEAVFKSAENKVAITDFDD